MGQVGKGWAWAFVVVAFWGLSCRGWADPTIARRLWVLERLVDPNASLSAPTVRTVSGGTGCSARHARLRSARDPGGRIDRAVRDASLRWAVDASLIRAVIRHESAGDVWALSSKGAQGLMQLMPATARELGVRCPFDPRENILGGTRYLRELRDRLGSWRRALAGYHAGPTRVLAKRIPRVTRAYVERVLRSWRASRRENGLFTSRSTRFRSSTSAGDAPVPGRSR